MWRRTTAWLLLAFVLSIAVRSPQLDRPLSKHHEFCTAVALIILQVWDEGGFVNNGGLPCVTFPGEANRYIADQTDGLVQRDGKQYYLSHVPLAYYLPFALFHIIGVHPDVLSLQLFNLFFHLLTALMLTGIVRLLLREADVEQRERAASIAGMFYLFMPAMLWYHGNVYMADMFVQNIWVVHLYFALKLFAMPRPTGRVLLLFGLTLALTTFTNWLGVFAGIAAAALAWQHWRKERAMIWSRVMLVCVIAIALPVGWTLWRYASIAGWENLMAHYGNRYEERGSEAFGGVAGFAYFLWRLAFNYLTAFAPLLLIIMGVWLWWRCSSKAPSQGGVPGAMFAWLALAPVAMDHIIFLKYALHEFAVLKASFYLCVLAALLVVDLRRAVWITALTCTAGIALFYMINPPGAIAQNGGRYDAQLELGRAIASRARPDEVVLITSAVLRDPMVILYAHRNLQRVADATEAERFLRQHHCGQGVLFDMIGGKLIEQQLTVPAK